LILIHEVLTSNLNRSNCIEFTSENDMLYCNTLRVSISNVIGQCSMTVTSSYTSELRHACEGQVTSQPVRGSSCCRRNCISIHRSV